MNNATAQVRNLFLSMTPGARIVAGLLLVAVVVSLGFLFQQGSAGPDVYLFGAEHLSDSELNRIEAAFGAQRLTGWTRDGKRIRVPAGQKSEFMAAVASAEALPRNFHSVLDKALNEGGVWESNEKWRHRQRVAKAQTLTEVIRAMNWVDDAIVMYDEDQANGFNRRKKVVGSVSVQPVVGESLTYERKKAIQNFLGKAIVDLAPESVAVVSLGDDTSYGGDGLPPEAFENDYLRNRALFNKLQRDLIYQQVSFIPNVRVQVNAELDNVTEDVSQTVKPDEKPQALHELTTKESTERTTSEKGGRPGPEAQGPYPEEEGLATDVKSDTTKSEMTDTQNLVGHLTQQIRKEGYVPKEVWATIAVPRAHLVNIWRKNNSQAPGQPAKNPTDADLKPVEEDVRKNIENLVQPLLPGHVAGEDAYKYVTVEFVDLIEPPPIPEPALADTAMAWAAQNWGRVSMVMLAVFSLLVIRSMAGARPSPTKSGGPTLSLDTGKQPSSANERPDEEEEDEEEPRPRLKLRKGHSLKDDLVEVVREDPDAAATILRNWIARAA